MKKVLVEFFGTCPGWRGEEQLVVAIVNSERWKDRVELRTYHLWEDPAPGLRYQPIDWVTVVVNGKTRIDRISAHRLIAALEAESGWKQVN